MRMQIRTEEGLNYYISNRIRGSDYHIVALSLNRTALSKLFKVDYSLLKPFNSISVSDFHFNNIPIFQSEYRTPCRLWYTKKTEKPASTFRSPDCVDIATNRVPMTLSIFDLDL